MSTTVDPVKPTGQGKVTKVLVRCHVEGLTYKPLGGYFVVSLTHLGEVLRAKYGEEKLKSFDIVRVERDED